MPWYLFRAFPRLVYTEAATEEEALARVEKAGFTVKKMSWGPFDHLWECSAKERFCSFDNGIWQDHPAKDKKFRALYVSLANHLLNPDVVVLKATDGPSPG